MSYRVCLVLGNWFGTYVQGFGQFLLWHSGCSSKRYGNHRSFRSEPFLSVFARASESSRAGILEISTEEETAVVAFDGAGVHYAAREGLEKRLLALLQEQGRVDRAKAQTARSFQSYSRHALPLGAVLVENALVSTSALRLGIQRLAELRPQASCRTHSHGALPVPFDRHAGTRGCRGARCP